MRKKQDIMWEQSTLWESAEKWVTKYLKKNHPEYRELQVKAMKIVDENPALRTLINCMESIALMPEDHKALHKLKNAHRLFLFLHINRTCIQIRLCNAEGFFNLS